MLALSPIVLLLIVGLSLPTYLDAYRTSGGTLDVLAAAVLTSGCLPLTRAAAKRLRGRTARVRVAVVLKHGKQVTRKTVSVRIAAARPAR